jgi:hypothetical protein
MARVSASDQSEVLAHGGAFIVVRSCGWSGADGATTCYHEPAGEGANACEPSLPRSVQSLQGSENSEAPASRRERGGRLDKLGVTGSSPVPPTEDAAQRHFRWLGWRRISLVKLESSLQRKLSMRSHAFAARSDLPDRSGIELMNPTP